RAQVRRKFLPIVKRSGFQLCEVLPERRNAGEAYPAWVRQTGRSLRFANNVSREELNPTT
ncbi:MAG: hypothetical protein ACRD37_14070, partial [Candidatus Acidiferrales bacterium]